MEEKRLLIPKLEKPSYKDRRNNTIEISILQKDEKTFVQTKSTDKTGATHLLQIEVPSQEKLTNTPLLIELEDPNNYQLKVTILRRTKTQTIILDPENPENNRFQESEGKILTEDGFLHIIATNPQLLTESIKFCQASPNEEKIEETLKKIDDLFDECTNTKTPWQKMKLELEPSPSFDQWPQGFFTQWLKTLDRTRTMEATKADTAWIEAQTHNWIFIPESLETQPGKRREKFIVTQLSCNQSLQLRTLVLNTALLNRPEEAADFIKTHPRFQKMEVTTQSPALTFYQWWTQNITPIRGILLPKTEPSQNG